MTKIIKVAIKLEDRIISLSPPNRHCDLLSLLWASNQKGSKVLGQGFIASDGANEAYVDRQEAYTIAEQAGQINPFADVATKGTLYSEDVW